MLLWLRPAFIELSLLLNATYCFILYMTQSPLTCFTPQVVQNMSFHQWYQVLFEDAVLVKVKRVVHVCECLSNRIKMGSEWIDGIRMSDDFHTVY